MSSSVAASGQPKTDVVSLANGDRITGEITAMDRGRLELETDDVGTIDIEWDNVASVEASAQFEVTMSDGRRFLGSLGRTTEPFVLATGGSSLIMAEVASIARIGASFWSKLEGSADLGFTYTKSSGIAQTTVNTDTMFRRPAFLVRLSGSATVTQRDDGSEPDDRADMEFSYERYRGRRLFFAGGARLESNESLGLELRSQVGGTAGLRLVNTARALFSVSGGLVGNQERGVDTEPTENLEGVVAARTSFYSYDRPKTSFDAQLQYYPSLSHWGRQRLHADLSLRRDLIRDLYFAIDLYDTFDSEPPNVESDRNDVGIVTSFGWSY